MGIALGFVSAVSTASFKEMRRKIWTMDIRSRTALFIEEIASWINPMVRSWLQYYGAFYRSDWEPAKVETRLGVVVDEGEVWLQATIGAI
jgi:hypothetical protein